MLTGFWRWLRDRVPRSASSSLAVTFDDEQVQIRAKGSMPAEWNQVFRWDAVEQVCVTDGGIGADDVIRLTVRGQATPIVVLLEAEGGSKFFGELCDRELLPESVWRAAMGETGGRTHCWPPNA